MGGGWTCFLDMAGMFFTMGGDMMRMCKTFWIVVSLLAAVGMTSPAATTGKSGKAAAAATAKPGSVVAEAVKEIPFITEKRPNPKAKFYVYLMSASWCAACNVEMPHVVEQYKEMAKKKVEIIYVNGDSTPEAAIAFMKKYKADFPCILTSSPETAKLPGYTLNTRFPWAIVVNNKGEVLESARANRIFNEWHRITGIKGKK